MKRTLGDHSSSDDLKMKKKKLEHEENDEPSSGINSLDDNLLFEVLKHVDGKSLAMASCVNKIWQKTAQDERLWEMTCTRHLANIGCGIQQFRFVVLVLGGFRRLYSLYLWHLSKPHSSPAASSSAAWAAAPFLPAIGSKPPKRLGKDEVHLSLSLLSIRYYEKMDFSKMKS
ncbi:F-box protein GID2-like [Rutidosis leptorrhynchoides]|uniref:F-box protein GID2-like n=1 Tax=Rutidosis leptorrhynchoides TaxID=125765 RepID=UPI003A9918ED